MNCVVPSMRPELLAALPQPLSSHKLVQVPLNMNKKEALKSGQNVVDRLSAWLQGCKRRLSKDLLPDPDDPAAGQEGSLRENPKQLCRPHRCSLTVCEDRLKVRDPSAGLPTL
ncbi:hypothetical protein ABPG77_008029 [Micractinium sp. CCAP 211/92]